MKVLLTGATGFVGKALLHSFKNAELIAAVREKSLELPQYVHQQVIGDINSSTDWSNPLTNVDVVIHAAARVHIMNDDSVEPFAVYIEANTESTLNLARQAIKSGVKRFIFISSIKVNGEMTRPGQLFTAGDNFVPSDPYGLSKYKAEKGLLKLAAESQMEIVIIRPPLVYGPGVKANFASMISWVNKGVPLPFGLIQNKRSLVALDNLVDFIDLCADREKSPKAANQVFLISDAEDVSTTELLIKVAKAFNKKAMLLPIPVGLMTFMAKLLGKADVANRLFGSLQVDSSKARNLLGWKPVITMDEQLQKTVEAYLNENNK